MSYLAQDGAADSTTGGKDPFFVEEYLDSPILITPRTQYFAALSNLPVQHDLSRPLSRSKIKTLTPPEKTAYNIITGVAGWKDYDMIDPDEYPALLHNLPAYEDLSSVHEAMNCACVISEDVREALSSWVRTMDPRSCAPPTDSSPTPGLTEREVSYYARFLTLDTIVGEVFTRNSRGKANLITGETSGIKWAVAENIALLDGRRGRTGQFRQVTFTWHQLLMFKDLCYSRAQVYTACRVMFPERPWLADLITRQFAWQEKCLTRHGNAGYEVAKQTEPLAKAYLSTMANDPLAADGPYPRMRDKVWMKEKQLGATTRGESLEGEYARILSDCRGVVDVVELFGLQKLIGHPLIDPVRGGLSAAGIAREPDTTLPQDANRLGWNFCRMFLQEYVRREGWPNLTFTEEGKYTELYRLHALRRRRLTVRSYPLSDWQHCTFGRLFELDYAVNYLELMDDRSISHYRDNLATTWDRDVPPTSHRRLLLQLLETEKIDMRGVANMVMRREVPLEWLIVCLYPKEREFKLDPRMFAMLVLEMRTFFSMHEMNIADNILEYTPQLTMTKSKNDVAKLFTMLTKPIEQASMLHLFLEVDLSRWNLRWRRLAVYAIGGRLDEMFDAPGFFTYVHDFFSQCLIIVRTRELRPPGIETMFPPESDLAWYNHLGGFEGLVQKLWSLATIAMIDIAVKDMPISYHLVGQADNQVLSVRWRRPSTGTLHASLVQMRSALLIAIEASCTRVHQEMKPEECLESTTVVTYSKDVYVAGVYYPTTLKFHCRLFPHASQDFPSVRSNVGAVFSTATAGSERTRKPLLSHFLGLFHAGLYLSRILTTGGYHRSEITKYLSSFGSGHRATLLQVALVLPSELSGFPVAPWTNFIYKGGSDPLSKALASLVLLQRCRRGRVYNRILSAVTRPEAFSSDTSPEVYLQDPYSIPLRTVATPTDIVSTETLEEITPHIRNEAIHQLVSCDITEYGEALSHDLMTLTPFNPLMARDIYDCSIAGVATTLKKMFTATRTVQTVARRTNKSLVTRVVTQDRIWLHAFFVFVSHLPVSPWRETSVYDLAEFLRSKWEACSLPPPVGMTTYSPFDTPLRVGRGCLAMEGLHVVVTAPPHAAATTRGPYDPYIGGKTHEKRAEHGYKIVSSETSSASLAKLQLILSQSSGDVNITHLIDCVGLSRSSLVLSSVTDSLPQVVGGLSFHRYAARAGHQAAYGVGAPTFASHCLISSDNSGCLAGGTQDYPLMFHEHFLAGMWVLEHFVSSQSLWDRSACLVTSALPMEPLPVTQLSMTCPPISSVLRLEGNPLAFIPGVIVRRVTGFAVPRHLTLIKGAAIQRPNADSTAIITTGWARHALRDHNEGRRAAEGLLPLFPTGRLDVAEVVAIGYKQLVQSCAVAIGDAYLMDTTREVRAGFARWELYEYLSRTSGVLAGHFGYLLGHPLLNSDPLVRAHSLYPSPGYLDQSSSAIARLTGLITRAAEHYFTELPDAFLNSGYTVFSSTPPNHTVEAIGVQIQKAILRAQRDRLLSPKAARHCTRVWILPTLRSSMEPPTKMFALQAAIVDARRWATTHRLGTLALDLARIQDGEAIQSLALSVSEAMRSLRGFRIEGGVTLPCVPPPLHPCEDSSKDRLMTWERRVVAERFVGLSLSPVAEEPWIQRYTRHMTFLGPPGSHHVGTWCLFPNTLEGRVVLVVGVGYGATAVACMLLGALHVYGLDLQCNTPLIPHRFVSYAPPLVKAGGWEARYTHSPVNFTSAGDWYDRETARAFTGHAPGSAVLVLDIEGRSADRVISQLQVILDVGYAGEVLLRATQTLDDWEIIYNSVRPHCPGCTVTVVDCRYQLIEAVLWCRRVVSLSPPGGPRMWAASLPPIAGPPHTHVAWDQVWSAYDACSVACLHSIDLTLDMSYSKAMDQVVARYRALAQDQNTPGTSVTLQCLRTCSLVLRLAKGGGCDYSALLARWVRTGVAWTRHDDLILAERITPALLLHLTGPGAVLARVAPAI